MTEQKKRILPFFMSDPPNTDEDVMRECKKIHRRCVMNCKDFPKRVDDPKMKEPIKSFWFYKNTCHVVLEKEVKISRWRLRGTSSHRIENPEYTFKPGSQVIGTFCMHERKKRRFGKGELVLRYNETLGKYVIGNPRKAKP